MRPFEQILSECGRTHRNAQYELDTNLFVKARVDEVAVLFENNDQLEAWLAWCSERDLEHIGSVAEDRMMPNGWTEEPVADTCFDVRFEFFRIPGAPWRIEAVCVLSGLENADLHRRHLEEWGSGSIIHASWKEPTLPDYASMKRILADAAVAQPLRMLAEYANSYGVFSYWNGDDAWKVYLKPRVNLQDQAQR